MTVSPIQQARQSIPWWMKSINSYDGLEVHPVRNLFSKEREDTWCEPCKPHEAEFWSVYGHCEHGGVESFEDFPTQRQARGFADQLLLAYPHLKKHGIWG